MQNVFHSLKQPFFSLHQELLPTSILLNNQYLLHYPHRFAYDIAISLYYWLWMLEIMKPELQNDDNRRKDISIHFLKNFITGYQTEYHFLKEWLDMMPVFVAIRQMELYLIFEERFGHITDLNSQLYLQTAQFKKNLLEKKQVVPFGVFTRKYYSLLV